ncbi:hypothetical protein [Tahibacter caeni]|uniref:hypothetical protein n=1 Tax=Tahibacter caeni TaxID=1453545 RepID=UPI002147CF4A|nr:hypothetical protein [Tahibacter caeni]
MLLPDLSVASEAVRAFIFQDRQPKNLSEHQRAITLFKRNELNLENIPRPVQTEESIECGAGTTILWEREDSGRIAIADSNFRSSVVVFVPGLAEDADPIEEKITFGQSGVLLYIAVEHAGEICAGYASQGDPKFHMLPDGSADVAIDAKVQKFQLVGSRWGDELSLSFKAQKMSRPRCK